MEIEKLDTIYLESLGVKEEVYNKFDIIILPENVLYKKPEEELIDSQETIEFYKYLKNNGIKVANSIDLDLKCKLIERRGGDVFWLGVIQFIQSGMVNIFWGLLQSYLDAKLKNDTSSSKPTEPKKKNIHITIKTKKFKMNYNGDVKDFMKIVKTFRIK